MASGMMMDIMKYARDWYSHEKGSRCAPKIMAKIITILVGAAAYAHMAIKMYKNWLMEKRMPRLFNALSLAENSAFKTLEIRNASGIKGAVQKKVKRFLVKTLSTGKSQTNNIPVHSTIDAMIKCKPLFVRLAKSRLVRSMSNSPFHIFPFSSIPRGEQKSFCRAITFQTYYRSV